jgi:hypothetical protein
MFAYNLTMFQSPTISRDFLVCCKGCRENIPAPCETVPAQPVAARCPLCGEHRQYLPSEIFAGRLSYLLMKKPVRSSWER